MSRFPIVLASWLTLALAACSGGGGGTLPSSAGGSGGLVPSAATNSNARETVGSSAATSTPGTYAVGGGWRVGGCAETQYGSDGEPPCPPYDALFKLHFAFSAHLSSTGVSGEATFDYPGAYHVTGDVTCLNVQGNQATISGQIRQSSPFLSGFPYFIFGVRDNSEASSGTPDQMSTVLFDNDPTFSDQDLFSPGTGQACSVVSPTLNYLTVEHGNISISTR